MASELTLLTRVTCDASNHDWTCLSSFCTFQEVCEEDACAIIKSSHITDYQTDPPPSSVFKESLNELFPVITTKINCSLARGMFPASLKHAIIKPHFKSEKHDVYELSSYRPIANVLYFGKLMRESPLVSYETIFKMRVCTLRRNQHFHQNHSMETTMFSIQNHILCALDRKSEALLPLLDYSSAFDTIYHQILLQRLETRYGIKGTVQKWFASYLKDRSQCVSVLDASSSDVMIDAGVP